jgi:hypothetical protein
MEQSLDHRGASNDGLRFMLADPTGQIERECADAVVKQRDVALTYALAMRDELYVTVDWKRANAAILARWPRGLERVKNMAWAHFRTSLKAS